MSLMLEHITIKARERALSNNHIPEEVYDNLVKLCINIYHYCTDTRN